MNPEQLGRVRTRLRPFTRFSESYTLTDDLPGELGWENPSAVSYKYIEQDGPAYLAAGDIFFANVRFRNFLGDLAPLDTVWFSDATLFKHMYGFRDSTILTGHLLRSLDLRGRRVADVGCGDGMLSVLALQQRASHVLGLDMSMDAEDAYLPTVRVNGYDAEFVRHEIHRWNKKGTGRLLANGRSEVIIANMGPEYGETDMHVFRVLPDSVDTVVVGGYARGHNKNRIQAAIRILEKDGFGGYVEMSAREGLFSFMMTRG